MTVPISNVVRRVVFAPSGTGPYAFTFEILAATDIQVYKGDTLLTLTTDYTVTINSNGTGSVTLVATAGTDNITVVGARTIQRTTDFVTGGDLFANSLNTELDSLTIFNQQNAEAVTRAVKVPVTDPVGVDLVLPSVATRANKYLAFNGSGNLIATAGTSETSPISSAMAPVVGASTLSTARTAMELGSMATQNANNVAITGGTITGITDLTVADGGTGRSTLTAENVLLGDGTNAVKFVAPGTSGNVLTSDGTTWTSAAVDKLSTASGSAPSYSARAWVNFDGTGTVAIRASGNVTSITDNGTGEYVVNFTTAMPDTNYGVAGSSSTDASVNGFLLAPGTTGRATTNVAVISLSNGGSVYDPQAMTVTIFR